MLPKIIEFIIFSLNQAPYDQLNKDLLDLADLPKVGDFNRPKTVVFDLVETSEEDHWRKILNNLWWVKTYFGEFEIKHEHQVEERGDALGHVQLFQDAVLLHPQLKHITSTSNEIITNSWIRISTFQLWQPPCGDWKIVGLHLPESS